MALLINPGHGPRNNGSTDPGCHNAKSKIYERDWVLRFATDVSAALVALQQPAPIILQDGDWSELPTRINQKHPSLIISYHLNAFNTKATGIETFFWNKSQKGKHVAQVVQDASVRALGLANRGIKPMFDQSERPDSWHQQRGYRLFKSTAAPCVLHEFFFLDNDSDLAVATAKYQPLVEAHAQACIKALQAMA